MLQIAVLTRIFSYPMPQIWQGRYYKFDIVSNDQGHSPLVKLDTEEKYRVLNEVLPSLEFVIEQVVRSFRLLMPMVVFHSKGISSTE